MAFLVAYLKCTGTTLWHRAPGYDQDTAMRHIIPRPSSATPATVCHASLLARFVAEPRTPVISPASASTRAQSASHSAKRRLPHEVVPSAPDDDERPSSCASLRSSASTPSCSCPVRSSAAGTSAACSAASFAAFAPDASARLRRRSSALSTTPNTGEPPRLDPLGEPSASHVSTGLARGVQALLLPCAARPARGPAAGDEAL